MPRLVSSPRACRNCGQPVPPEDERSYQPWADWITHLSPSCCAIAVIRARIPATPTLSEAQ